MCEDGCGQGRQALVGTHQVEIDIGLNIEQVQHLVEHLAVLGSDTYTRLNPRLGCQALHDRGHFYCLRPGAEDGEDANCHNLRKIGNGSRE
jgi:hypothetical protein